jgi:pyruvate/2-oxoglutarate dehydrogenase complex dihydrolipoamide dehydrogenase (E3) component
MSVDYDIVVIGMSAHAQKLVSLAVQREARVAWVWDQEFCDQYSNAYLNIDQIDHILLLLQNKLSDCPKSERVHFFAQQIASIRDNFCQEELLEILQKNGVDVIIGECKFQGKVHNSHVLKVSETAFSERSRAFSQRSLSSRAYAIAHDITPQRKIFGLAEYNYLTANQLLNLKDLPNSIAVLGDDSKACAIAQAINFLGINTSLVTDHNHILPNVDVAIARTLQAQLEAEGINVYTNTQTTAVSQLEHSRIRIWLDNQTIECDRLLIPVAPKEFGFPSDRHIYQCHGDQDIAKILQQTLQTGFWRSSSIPQIPTMINVSTTPTVAQVGMTELFAKQKYGQALYILESSTENSLCKIICNHKGQILGASMFGDRAKLVIEAIAIAMQGQVKIQNITVLQELQITEQWEKLHRDRRQQAKFKNWFTFRRDWNI